MQQIREYLVTVIAAAIICSIAGVLIGKNAANNVILKLLTGVFLSITVISPFLNIRFSNFSAFFSDIQEEGGILAEDGRDQASEAMLEIIKEQAETYVINKAATMNLDIRAEIKLSDTEPPYPASVKITGDVPPYKKSVLKKMIAEDLGIPEASQFWM